MSRLLPLHHPVPSLRYVAASMFAGVVRVVVASVADVAIVAHSFIASNSGRAEFIDCCAHFVWKEVARLLLPGLECAYHQAHQGKEKNGDEPNGTTPEEPVEADDSKKKKNRKKKGNK